MFKKIYFLRSRVTSNYNTLEIIHKLEGHHIDAYRCFLKALTFQPSGQLDLIFQIV